MVSQVYRARYHPTPSFLTTKLGSNPSYTWRSIWATRDLISQNSRIQVGDGCTIRVTKDPCLQAALGFITSSLGAEYDGLMVKDLMVPGKLQWDRDLIEDVFNPRDKEVILNVPLSCRMIEDKWYWLHEGKRFYSVKSCYRAQQSTLNDMRSQIWATLWKLNIPPKVRNCMWRALQDVLPTADNLRNRRVQVGFLCPVCVQERDPPITFY